MVFLKRNVRMCYGVFGGMRLLYCYVRAGACASWGMEDRL